VLTEIRNFSRIQLQELNNFLFNAHGEVNPGQGKTNTSNTGRGRPMLIDYLAILIWFAIAVFFAIFAIAASYLLGQRKPTAAKQAPYECGVTTIDSSFRRIPIKYYIIAMLFLLFDIEVIFLYPWAVVFKQFKLFAFFSMAVFIGILLIAYIYIWKKGALEWE
jgi:NADH-quinone oxidoreductase subunit A